MAETLQFAYAMSYDSEELWFKIYQAVLEVLKLEIGLFEVFRINEIFNNLI